MTSLCNTGNTATFALACALTCSAAVQAQHPGPQPRPAPSEQTLSADGNTTTIVTAEGHFPSQDPFREPPGSNLLENVYTNMFDSLGNEMPNTLPSTPDNPYNLHPDPIVTEIDKTSPTDDLVVVIKTLRDQINRHSTLNRRAIKLGIDILEGNPVPGRSYSGFPLLHYLGPEKTKKVEPILDSAGNTIGGNVNIHQIWYDNHIESDTAFIDPSAVWDVPWTITYTIDTLNRGHEDFSPMVMYFDHPDLNPNGRVPHVMMDQTFFPMEDGTRTVYEVAMSLGKYYNLSYHWGWRFHPPRVQVAENALKVAGGKTLPEWESSVFGPAPRSSLKAKLKAINMIGNLAPAKRMWNDFRWLELIARIHKDNIVSKKIANRLVNRIEAAFFDWKDRKSLPAGVTPDPDADMTLFYANNTIYGQLKGQVNPGQAVLRKWKTRPANVKIKLLNGDYFMHAYMTPDFGGSRGWENTFQSTQAIGGAGPWFTFGRAHWWVNGGAPAGEVVGGFTEGLISVPPANRWRPLSVGEHNVDMTLNYEPSRRLRLYQFDPLHHDVAIWSVH